MNNYNDYQKKFNQLKDLIDFLAKIEDTIDEERFLELTFNKIFSFNEKFNLGSLYIFTNKSRVRFIDAIGHNLNYLKNSNLHLLDFKYSTQEVKIIKNITKETKKLFIRSNKLKDFKEYNDNIIDTKETLLMPILYEGEIVAECAFEISHDSNENFNDDDIESLELFRKIIENKFNEILYKNKVKNNLKLIEDKYKEELRIDHLTKVYNKKYFYEVLSQEYRTALRNKNQVALIMIDIDYFKDYNDNYGHIKGDEVLIQVVEAFKNVLKRSTDSIFRYGGEEFVVLITDTNKSEALIVANKLKKAVENLKIKNIVDGEVTFLTVSLGIHIDIPNKISEKEFLACADKAMYKAKTLGRNQIKIYKDSMSCNLKKPTHLKKVK